jgi:type III pantothenate kinase
VPDSNPILLIDLGNSSLKWAWSNAGELTPVQSVPHLATTVDSIAKEWWQGEPEPGRVVVSSVARPEVRESLRTWLQQQWGCEPAFIQASAKAHGVTNAYSKPSELGVDRWLALLAVHHRFSAPVCVVDCGTAITIDLVAADGIHIGGMIIPGFGMMRDALFEQTAISPPDVVELPDWLANDTAGAIAIGGVSAVAALVDRILEQSQQRLRVLPELVLTGGDAGRIQGHLLHPGKCEPDLVIQGLALLANSTSDD